MKLKSLLEERADVILNWLALIALLTVGIVWH